MHVGMGRTCKRHTERKGLLEVVGLKPGSLVLWSSGATTEPQSCTVCFLTLKVETHQTNVKELAATKANCCVASCRRCLGQKVELEHPTKTANGQLARTFCACVYSGIINIHIYRSFWIRCVANKWCKKDRCRWKRRWIQPLASYSPVKTSLYAVLSPKYPMYLEHKMIMEFPGQGDYDKWVCLASAAFTTHPCFERY